MTRTIFIGDVHGCILELEKLLSRLNIVRNDRVIFLGDLINKGPNSVEVIKLIRKNNFEVILGNHELSYKNERANQNKLRPHHLEIQEKLTEEEENWLISHPIFIEDKQFIAVHGGIIPEVSSLQDSDPKILTTIREWKDGRAWHSFYDKKRIVFYGHWAAQGLCIRSNTIGLDSGCVYGGGLSAYILEESRLIWIPSKQYALIEE